VAETATDREPGSPATGPSGLLAQRVGDHVASADRLIQQSHQLIAQIKDRMRQTDRRVGRTLHRVRDAAGLARVVERSAGGAEQRYLRAKQRELAAHELAIRRHDEAAALQERLGHADRAASARAHGRHARELHVQALQELQAWAGQPPADDG
jgi:hypothetical protein